MADDPRPDSPDGAPAAPRAGETVPPIGRTSEPTRITPRSPRARLEPERVPPPARPSRRARHPIIIAGNAIFTGLIVLAIAAGVGFGIGKQRFEAPGPLDSDRVVNIPARTGLADIADLLVREGVIDQKWVFVGGVLLNKAHEDLKAGEYMFHPGASVRDVLATIVEGKVVLHQLTVPEGLTSQQVVARLLESDILSGSVREMPREGALLPDTYRFARGFPREQLITRMQQSQKRVLQEAWDRRSPDLPVKTPEQLLVLASIVEKETGKADERTRVAAVFANRLRQRMKLQSDPTIIYGLVGGKGTLGRPIMRSEIEQPTPYNTYAIEGLPPGPIANPGRASIEAAANPSRTKELFFVADGTGGHTFSETYDQHQRAVARLRQLEQQQREASRAPATPPDTVAPSLLPVAPPEAPAAAPAPTGATPAQRPPPPPRTTSRPPPARQQ
jgi:UPF0755 protein